MLGSPVREICTPGSEWGFGHKKETSRPVSTIHTLFKKAKRQLEKDPFSGHLFLFLNRRRTSCKALYYDGTGLVIIAKRLERGTFAYINPHYKGEICLTQAEFVLLFEGASLDKRFIESPTDPRQKYSKN